MLFYLITFSISLLAAEEADQYYEDRTKYYIFSFIAVLPLILLASVRDHTVGSDTDFYHIPVWIKSVYFHGTFEELNSMSTQEGGYIFINYLISRFTQNIFFLFLVLYSFVFIPFYVVAFKFRKMASPVLILFFFYFLFYNESLSTVRQAVAMSLAMLGLVCLIQKKYYWTIIYLLIAFSFHVSTILMLIFPLIYKTIKNVKLLNHPYLYFSFAIIAYLVFTFTDEIISLLISSNIIDAKYIVYTSENDTFEAGLNKTYLIMKIAILLYVMIVFIFRKRYKKLVQFSLIVASLDLGMTMLGEINFHLIRLTLYPRLMSCLYLPILFRKFKFHIPINKAYYEIPISSVMIIMTLIYWYYVYIHGDFAATSEYKISSTL